MKGKISHMPVLINPITAYGSTSTSAPVANISNLIGWFIITGKTIDSSLPAQLSCCLSVTSGLKVIKLFSCSTQLNTKFILLINVKMPTIIGNLTFISKVNTTSESLKARKSVFFCILVFMSS